MIDIRDELTDNILFEEDLRKEHEAHKEIKANHQIRYMPGGDDVKGKTKKTLVAERGVFVTLAQMLFDTPSMVARNDFLKDIISQTFEAAKELHANGIYHTCFAPENLLIRRGDGRLMLLNHGSFYQNIENQEELYGDLASYVAPEVLAHGTIDERCDVYSIGKLIEYLYSTGSMPMPVKKVVKKATRELPEDRYDSVRNMEKALKRLAAFRRQAVTLLTAAAATAIIVGAYFSIVPEQNEMEYIKPAPQPKTEDFLDEGIDPTTELGILPTDSSGALTEAQKKKMEEYQKKAEDIFRKRFEKEADRILSKVYNAGVMNSSQSKFSASSQKAISELNEVQEKIASQTAMPMSKSQRIAQEIIDRVSNMKKKEIKQ
ncbi:MAG: hypothetical protein MR900_07725 [Prevotella sp.]|nr:hypothetical protein [Prevotella sp.]